MHYYSNTAQTPKNDYIYFLIKRVQIILGVKTTSVF